LKNETTLDDLDFLYHTEISFDDFIIPIKINIEDITESDYIQAVSVMNDYKTKRIEPQIKEHNDLADIKIVDINNGKITLSYQKLYYEEDIEFLKQQERMKYCFKFINIEDKLFEDNTKNLLEYLECEDIVEWLNERGMTEEFYTKLYLITSYWIDVMVTELHANTKVALLLTNKKGTDMNYSLSKLTSCYKNANMHYFTENRDVKTYRDISYREQHLRQSYDTKMNYIEIAINEKTKSEIDKAKTNSSKAHKSSGRGKF